MARPHAGSQLGNGLVHLSHVPYVFVTHVTLVIIHMSRLLFTYDLPLAGLPLNLEQPLFILGFPGTPVPAPDSFSAVTSPDPILPGIGKVLLPRGILLKGGSAFPPYASTLLMIF